MTHVPQWLQDRQAEYARAAQMRMCKKCGSPILVGLDDDVAALKVEIDPTPITSLGEAVALLAGRGTYELHSGRGQKNISHRAEWNIRGPRRRAVFPAHRCDQPLDAHLDTTWTTPTTEDQFPTPDGFPF
jgi:hypothetical protein